MIFNALAETFEQQDRNHDLFRASLGKQLHPLVGKRHIHVSLLHPLLGKRYIHVALG